MIALVVNTSLTLLKLIASTVLLVNITKMLENLHANSVNRGHSRRILDLHRAQIALLEAMRLLRSVVLPRALFALSDHILPPIDKLSALRVLPARLRSVWDLRNVLHALLVIMMPRVGQVSRVLSVLRDTMAPQPA